MNIHTMPGNEGSGNPVVIVKDGEAVADSRDVAAFFGKQHKDVLRAVRSLGCSQDFSRRTFALREEIQAHSTGSAKYTYYLMTKDGFTFLVMGFTGKEAARFKEAYIERFNEMERLLRDDLDDDFDLPSLRDRRVWGVDVGTLNAAARACSLMNRIYGPEAARALWKADANLPQVGRFAISALAGTASDDPKGCFQHLVRSAVGNGRTVKDVLQLALHDSVAAKSLREYGIVVDPHEASGCIAIANNHRFLASVFADTQWNEDWRIALAQLPGARASKGAIGFGGGNARAVLLPRPVVIDLLNPAHMH